MKRYAILFLALLSGCTNTDQKDAALAFSSDAEQCLLAVRDKGMKFEDSSDCAHLKQSSQHYIDLGGQADGERAETALIAEQGRAMAWMAKAISATGDPTIAPW